MAATMSELARRAARRRPRGRRARARYTRLRALVYHRLARSRPTRSSARFCVRARLSQIAQWRVCLQEYLMLAWRRSR